MRPGPTLWPHFTFITSLKTHLQYSHILRNWGPGLQPVNLGDTTQPLTVDHCHLAYTV